MLTIRTLFSEIRIDNTKEYAIYDMHYYADFHGNPLDEKSEEVKNLQCYDYGHIVIETEKMRYTFKKIPDSYNWVVYMLDYIDSKHNEGEKDVYVDMNQLINLGDDYQEFVCSDCCVEHI